MTSIKEARERLRKMVDSHIVDPTPLNILGQFDATYGDLRTVLAALAQLDSADANPAWNARTHDEIIKRLMSQVGMPNSMSLYQAFKQFANELHALSTGLLPDASPGNGAEKVREALCISGVGRDAEHDKSLCFYFSRRVTDDEMRFLHEVMQRAVACAPKDDAK